MEQFSIKIAAMLSLLSHHDNHLIEAADDASPGSCVPSRIEIPVITVV